MICPKCNTEITDVVVISQCSQRGTLEGNTIISYDDLEVLSETISIECPECNQELKDFIEEE